MANPQTNYVVAPQNTYMGAFIFSGKGKDFQPDVLDCFPEWVHKNNDDPEKILLGEKAGKISVDNTCYTFICTHACGQDHQYVRGVSIIDHLDFPKAIDDVMATLRLGRMEKSIPFLRGFEPNTVGMALQPKLEAILQKINKIV